jgi:hypothetical protein
VPCGEGNSAAHICSTACGSGTQTRQNFDIVVGCDSSTSGVTYISDVANNTIRLQGISGDIYATGTLHSGGADYCELFEWDTIEKSDKLGLFVSLVNGDKIEVGNKNIIGVISNKPTVLGNSSPNQWINMYEKNEWGEKVTKIYNIYNIEGINVYVDSEGAKYSEYPNPKFPSGISFDGDVSNGKIISTIEIAVINPLYNANIEYTDRSIRPEWGKVGLLGRLLVKTSEKITSSFVDAGSDGKAINGTKYPVLKTVKEYKDGDYGIVQILFR